MKKLYLIAVSLLCVTQLAYAQDPQGGRASTGTAANRSVVEMLYRMDQLQKELQQLRGEMELVNHELSGIKRRQRELYLDIDRRLSDLEAGGVRQNSGQAGSGQFGQQNQVIDASDPNVKAPAVVQSTTPEPPQPPTREEKDTYRAAFNLLKEGRYNQSIKAFTGFLTQYPNSTYADNAQYWLGEANYVSRKYPAAVTEFNKVITAFPNSTKVPDAMLKLGFTHYELKQWGKARDILTAVTQKYPDSSAAKLADTRLQRLKREGH